MPNRRRISVQGKPGAAYEPIDAEIQRLERTLARLSPGCGTNDELALRARFAGAPVPLPRVRSSLLRAASELGEVFEQMRDEYGDAIDAADAIARKMRPSAPTRLRRAPYVKNLRNNAGDFATLLAAVTAVFQLGWGGDPAWDVDDDIAWAVVRTLGIDSASPDLKPGIPELIRVDPDRIRKIGFLPTEDLPDKVQGLNDDDIDAACIMVCAVVEHPQAVLQEINRHAGGGDPRLAALLNTLSATTDQWKSLAVFVVIVATIHHRLRSEEVVRQVPASKSALDNLIASARHIVDGQAAA